MEAERKRALGRTALTVAALGVVFGDIGTSPIYTIQTAFNPGDPHPIGTSLDTVYGIVSLIFWAVTIEVTDQVRRSGDERRQRRARAGSWR